MEFLCECLHSLTEKSVFSNLWVTRSNLDPLQNVWERSNLIVLGKLGVMGMPRVWVKRGTYKCWWIHWISGWWQRNVPESACWVMHWSSKATSSLGCQICSKRRHCLVIVAGIVGKLDGDWFCWSLRYCSIKFLDCTFSFHALIEADEADPFWETCKTEISAE